MPPSFPMGIWNKCNSNVRASILKGIYQDNLRIAGKCAPEPLIANNSLLLKKLATMLLVVLATTFYPFTESDPSLSEIEVSPKMVSAATSVESESDIDASASGPDMAWQFGPIQSYLAGRLVPLPAWWDWDLNVPVNENDLDYSLLFSRSEAVRFFSLFGLGIKTIVIDPGHGGKDPGAIGANGTMEKDITLDVAVRLKKRLRKVGTFDILLTRDSDRTISLAERVEYAKEKKADLFISVHVNSMPNKTVNAIETYYFGPPLNSETLQIAEQENKDSHYTIGELNAIIQDIGNTVKRQESAMLAAAIQKSLLKNVRHHDAEVLDFGIKMAPFVVLSQIEVPSVLVEIACLTQKQEEAKLASAKYREKVAAFMEEGIVAYLETQQFNLISGGK